MGRHGDGLERGGNLDEIRRMVLARSKIPVGTVPVYQAFIESFSKRGRGLFFRR